MKQYRITTQNLNLPSDDDCILAPDDPIHALLASQIMGGLGTEARLAEYRAQNLPQIDNTLNKGKYMQNHNIKPGSDEWFKLWFARPNITGEKPME